MELPSKLLEQTAFTTRAEIEEHLLIVLDDSIHEEHLSRTLQTNKKQCKIAVTIFSAYIGIFNVTNSNNKFYLKKALINVDFSRIRIPEGVYELESLNNESKWIVTAEEHHTEANYPFTIKPNISTLGSIIQISPQVPILYLMILLTIF